MLRLEGFALEWSHTRYEPFDPAEYDVNKDERTEVSFYILATHVACFSLGRVFKWVAPATLLLIIS